MSNILQYAKNINQASHQDIPLGQYLYSTSAVATTGSSHFNTPIRNQNQIKSNEFRLNIILLYYYTIV